MLLNIPDAVLLILPAAAAGFVAGWQLRGRAAPPRQSAEAAAPSVPTARRTAAAPTAEDADTVPVVTRTRPPRPTPLPPAPPPPAADLLLVDDSAVARAKLRKLFEAAGYRVHLASDGVEALALLDKGDYRMLITDLEMPNMDGITLINACRARPQTARMPMLAITGHESLRAKFNECRDVAGIHRKPWVDDILLSHVATLVGARGRNRLGGPAPASGLPA